jgi:hypothetical protein
MKDSTVDILINPYNKESHHYKNEGALVHFSGNIIPVINGIPDFLVLENTDGLN